MKLIFGFGISGQSIARYCLRSSIPFHIVDTRFEVPQLLEFQQHVEANEVSVMFGAELKRLMNSTHDTEVYLSRFSEIMVSPGVSLDHPLLKLAQQRGIALQNDISLFMTELRHVLPEVKVVAVTGSNGKSTVVDAVAFVGLELGVSAYAIGNIGTPVLDVLPQLKANDLVVLELSSYQLELVHQLAADVAVLLNVSEDHLDRHGTLQAYWAAKQKVYEKAKVVLVNKDDPLSVPLAPHKETGYLQRYVRFGVGAPDRDDFGIVMRGGERWFAKGVQLLQPTSMGDLQGRHNEMNALVIMAIGDVLGWPLDAVYEVLSRYRGLPYRCQLEQTQDGVTWINDSKGTNVGASLVALRSAQHYLKDGGVWWIAGGLAKGGNFAPIARYLKSLVIKDQLKSAVLYGQDREHIQEALERESIYDYYIVQFLGEAVQYIQSQVCAGDVVVFSPACASMDQFANFEDRGQAFSGLIH